MKPTFLVIIALALTPPLMAAQKGHKAQTSPKKPTSLKTEADAINFSVKGADGSVKNYHLEVPETAGKPQNLTFKVSEQAAALAAVHWAVGYYGASNVTAYTVDYKTTSKYKPVPYPYYLVNMTGKVGDSSQPLYAAVLESGELVRPVETTSPPAAPTKTKAKSKKSKA